jgi:UDP-galactopyranose mutase
MPRCVVVGCGIAGAVSARLLADAGRDVLVVETRRHLGGHCRDGLNEHGHLVHVYGPHIFHTADREVWEYLSAFTRWRHYQHRVLAYVHGRLVPFPINRDTLCELFGLALTAEQVEPYLAEQVRKSTYADPPRSFRDAVVSVVGEELYRLFYEGYTAKQWNRRPEELEADLARRIPVRANRDSRYFADPYQGIPALGYARMFDAIVDHPRIRLLLGCDYFDARAELDAPLTVYTGEMDRFFEERHGRLEYSSLDFVSETLDQEQFQPVGVVNYPNDNAWTRITEYKHLTGQRDPRTTICTEYPRPSGEPYYPVLTRANRLVRDEYLKDVTELEKRGTHLFVGRLARYAYLNMDQVVRAALDGVGKWLASH